MGIKPIGHNQYDILLILRTSGDWMSINLLFSVPRIGSRSDWHRALAALLFHGLIDREGDSVRINSFGKESSKRKEKLYKKREEKYEVAIVKAIEELKAENLCHCRPCADSRMVYGPQNSRNCRSR
jgi:hypothetical protein